MGCLMWLEAWLGYPCWNLTQWTLWLKSVLVGGGRMIQSSVKIVFANG